jgi:predicted kinase
MKKFLQKLFEEEQTENPVVMAFGRMNPPTTGHEKLVNRVKEIASDYKAPYHIILSHSTDAKKNPLDSKTKLKHAKRFFPDANIESATKEMPTFLHHAQRLNAAGHDHLVMVAGSDRIDEYDRLLHHYNGTSTNNPKALYHYKKIEIKSAGHRDPDAEGAEGMSASKMREHAKNNDFHSFKQGVPSHVQDKHARELMSDVRRGMGINENVNHGLFKAIFICGGPGSGKDVIIRESIGDFAATEVNTTIALNVFERVIQERYRDISNTILREKKPIVINCNSSDEFKIIEIKEELRDLGYETMFIFVNTTDEVSKQRNLKLERVLSESVRREKWEATQNLIEKLKSEFDIFIEYDNSMNINEATYFELADREEEIHLMKETVDLFFDMPVKNKTGSSWLTRNRKQDIDVLFTEVFDKTKEGKTNESTYSKSIRTIQEKAGCTCGTGKTTRTGWLGKSSGGEKSGNRKLLDNICPSCQLRAKEGRIDSVTDGDIASNTKYTFRTYHETKEEVQPTIKIKPEPKETNFQQDNDKQKSKKAKSSIGGGKLFSAYGVGPEYDTRGQGTVYPMSGLGQVTYKEQKENKYGNNLKRFSKFREAIDSPSVEMGVTGGEYGPSNKEPMQTQYDKLNNQVSNVKRKKK